LGLTTISGPNALDVALMPAKTHWIWQPCLGLTWLLDPRILGLILKNKRMDLTWLLDLVVWVKNKKK